MAIETYEQALALDPKIFTRLCGACRSPSIQVIYGVAPASEQFRKARVAAMKALELDSTLPGTHTVFGAITFFQNRDFNALESGTQRALDRGITFLQSLGSPEIVRAISFYAGQISLYAGQISFNAGTHNIKGFKPLWTGGLLNERSFSIMAPSSI
jgi:hypothetical protein